MQYHDRGRHAINRAARSQEKLFRIAQVQSVVVPPPPVERRHALSLRAIAYVDALGRMLQHVAARARIRVARSPPG